mmetsp:Transcript_114954/g.325607  ORF Transcript_114954/g.325607 Transcript_114954/m.325607 type:complete len:240 (+) Transcript_114954:585-1304(+)
MLLVRRQVADPLAGSACLASHALCVLAEFVLEVVAVVHASDPKVVPQSLQEGHGPDLRRVWARLVHGHDVLLLQLRRTLRVRARYVLHGALRVPLLLLRHLLVFPSVEAGVAEQVGAGRDHRPQNHEMAHRAHKVVAPTLHLQLLRRHAAAAPVVQDQRSPLSLSCCLLRLAGVLARILAGFTGGLGRLLRLVRARALVAARVLGSLRILRRRRVALRNSRGTGRAAAAAAARARAACF